MAVGSRRLEGQRLSESRLSPTAVDRYAIPNPLFVFVHEWLKQCYLSSTSIASKIQRGVILALCLETLESGRENSDLIRQLERQLSGVDEMGLGMAPIQLVDLLQGIETWKKAHWRT